MKIRFKTSTQVWKVVGVTLLVCGLQLYGQQRASGAEAEAKAATYTTFDHTGSTYIQRQAINPAEAVTGTTVTQAAFNTASCGPPPTQMNDTEGFGGSD